MPMWSNRVWDPDDLAAELSGQRPSDEAAAEEVLDLPWFQKHQCEVAAAITSKQLDRA
jgi:hypothetical protein